MERVGAAQGTYIDSDSGLIEDEHGRHVPGYIAVELVAVLVELDRVQCLSVQIVVALEMCIRVAHRVVGDAHFSQSQAIYRDDDNCRVETKKGGEWELVTSCRGSISCWHY